MSDKYRDRLLQSSGVSNRKFQSQYAKKLMSQMGWKQGNGLGKQQQGTKQCVQIRRRQDGLGLGIKNANQPMNWKDQWWNDAYNKSIKKINIVPTKFKKNTKKSKKQKEDLFSSSSSSSSSDDSSSSSSSQQEVHLPVLAAKHKKIAKKSHRKQ